MKEKSVIPETLTGWQNRICAEPTADVSPQPKPAPPVGNDEKLRREIEARGIWLRLDYFVHEMGCKPPCKCRVKAVVFVFSRHRKPEKKFVTFRE